LLPTGRLRHDQQELKEHKVLLEVKVLKEPKEHKVL
jgi:hypothetical protein